MCLDRFQFQFLYQRFQLKGIQLLFPALGHIMVHKINKAPYKEKNKVENALLRTSKNLLSQ